MAAVPVSIDDIKAQPCNPPQPFILHLPSHPLPLSSHCTFQKNKYGVSVHCHSPLPDCAHMQLARSSCSGKQDINCPCIPVQRSVSPKLGEPSPDVRAILPIASGHLSDGRGSEAGQSNQRLPRERGQVALTGSGDAEHSGASACIRLRGKLTYGLWWEHAQLVGGVLDVDRSVLLVRPCPSRGHVGQAGRVQPVVCRPRFRD